MRCELPNEVLVARVMDYVDKLHIRGIVFDLENTLVEYGALQLPRSTGRMLLRLQSRPVALLVASNGRPSRINAELAGLGIRCVARCWKPLPFCVAKWCRAHCLSTSDILVVGDQFLTDGFLAVLLRAHLILLTPYSRSEPSWARFQRSVGRFLKPLFIRTVHGAIGQSS